MLAPSDPPAPPPHGETLLRWAIRDLPDAVMVVGRDQRIQYLNPSAAELLGVEAEEALGRPCYEVFRSAGCRPGCGALQLEAARTDTHEVNTPARHLWVSKTAAPVRDDQQCVVGLVAILRELPGAPPSLAPPVGEGPVMRSIVGRSAAIRRLADTLRRLANTEIPVLITGESGTGKELLAQALHESSRRRQGRFVAINCAALPASLIESELFGHVRGAFTGAIRDREGAVERADGGTLFLDEIGDLALPLQGKLLRLLQERTYQRVGETQDRVATARFVAATNVDLERAVVEGRFREDLYWRLKVVPLNIPPLRERREDIQPLASYLLARRSVAAGRLPMRFTREALHLLEVADWPGNVRELSNVIDYLVALATDDHVGPSSLPEALRQPPPAGPPDRGAKRYSAAADAQQERERILASLRQNDYHRQRTAVALGMDRVTLYRKMKEYDIVPPRQQ